MKFSIVLSSALFFAAISATPERRAARQAGRRFDIGLMQPGSSGITGDVERSIESSSWAGAIIIAPPSGELWKSVTGTIVVPAPKIPTGGSTATEYAGSAWIGIDGYTCSTPILQTGIDWYIENGVVSYDSWFEWYPDYAYDYAGVTIAAGQTITLTVTATSATAGTATIKNVSTDKSVTHTFTGEPGSLCRLNAEWIIEDPGSTGIEFANFGSIAFTNAYATTNTGVVVTVSDADTFYIERNGAILASTVIASSSEIVVTYK